MARLELWYPVKPYSVNQPFGANLPCVENFGTPAQNIIMGADNATCPVGYDKLYPHFGMSGHNGIDLMAGEQPVYAACDGVVVEMQTVPARGFGLGILTNEPVDLDGFGTHYVKLRYWHLKYFIVEVGDVVKIGQQIGVSNNTGYSSANHLHFEGQPMDKDSGGHPILVFPVDPSDRTDVIGSAIDMAPYWSKYYATDHSLVMALLNGEVTVLKLLITALKKILGV